MTGKQARRYARAFKLAALARMAAGEKVPALARELLVKRTLLYRWRDGFRAGGGRSPSSSARSVGSNRTWIFSRQPCGISRRHAGRATGLARRRLRLHPSDGAPARRRAAGGACGGADVCTGRGEPRRLLPRLGRERPRVPGDGGQGCHPAPGACPPPLRLSADHGPARARGLGGRPQARRPADARGQPLVPAQAGVQAADHGLLARLADLAEPGASAGADGGQPALGGRHHLCPPGRGLRLPGVYLAVLLDAFSRRVVGRALPITRRPA